MPGRIGVAYKPQHWSRPLVTLGAADLSAGEVKTREWILANGLGGYASSTVVGLNARRYHGLLVSASRSIRRRLFLAKLDEELGLDGGVRSLAVNEFVGGGVDEGLRYLKSFEYSPDSVGYHYDVEGVRVLKSVHAVSKRNAVNIVYEVSNRTKNKVTLKLKPLVTSREIHEVKRRGGVTLESRIFGGKAVGVRGPEGYLMLYSNHSSRARCIESSVWVENLRYSMEPDGVEDLFCPAFFVVDVEPLETEVLTVLAVGCENEGETARVFKEVSSGGVEKKRGFVSGEKGSLVIGLLNASESFVVDVMSKKTVLAGYHWLDQSGRDAMIALPGLTLACGRVDDAEKILEYYLNHARGGRIPSRIANGGFEYDDFDSTLWLIDRVFQYMKYAGVGRGKLFLHTYWWTLKDALKYFSEFERDGLLVHKSGTWMGGVERNTAVEVQGLWYNALCVMKKLAVIMEDEVNVDGMIKRFEENFMEKFWNETYLSDCLGDARVRPNQVIPLSLDFSVVDKRRGMSLLKTVDEKLLTPCGLRTLAKDDLDYQGKCDKFFEEKSCYNGGVWPWLIGPYVKSIVGVHGVEARKNAAKFLDKLLERNLWSRGLGCLSEMFDGDEPYTPRGCISHAAAVGEVTRTYFEDVLRRRPPHEEELLKA